MIKWTYWPTEKNWRKSYIMMVMWVSSVLSVMHVFLGPEHSTALLLVNLWPQGALCELHVLCIGAKNTCQLFSAVVRLLPNNMVYRASFCGPVLDVSILNLSLVPALSTFTILQQSMCLNVSVSNRTTWHEAALQHSRGEGGGRGGEEQAESRNCCLTVWQRGRGAFIHTYC